MAAPDRLIMIYNDEPIFATHLLVNSWQVEYKKLSTQSYKQRKNILDQNTTQALKFTINYYNAHSVQSLDPWIN